MKLKEEDLPQTDGEWEYNRYTCWHSTLNGQTHNSLGPAVIYDNGRKEWCIDGKLHRLDGPAVEYANGFKARYVDGKRILEQDFSSAVISFLLGVDRKIAELIEQEIEQ